MPSNGDHDPSAKYLVDSRLVDGEQRRSVGRCLPRHAALGRDARRRDFLPSHLEDPFEPLLVMFEWGGGFTGCGGFIDLGGSSVLQKTWRDHLSRNRSCPWT